MDMSAAMPKIAVAVPTYNRSALLRETLVCLRDQTHDDFVVTVLDNGSPDDTAAVFQATVGGDPRFTYRLQSPAVPVMQNFMDGLHGATADYFMWRADDDLSAPNYLASLADQLDRDPDSDLAVSPVQRWTAQTNATRTIDLPPFPGDSMTDRAIHLLRHARPTWIYGLWRRTALLRNFAVIGDRYPYLWASDHMLMAPSVLAGRISLAQDTLFTQRILGSGSYMLGTADQLQARARYAAICDDIMTGIDIPPDRAAAFRAALAFHLDDRVGPLRRLQRRLFKEKLRRMLGLGTG